MRAHQRPVRRRMGGELLRIRIDGPRTSSGSTPCRSSSRRHGPFRAATASFEVLYTAAARCGCRPLRVTASRPLRSASRNLIRRPGPNGRSGSKTSGPPLAWSEGYGDLWIDHFELGTPHATARSDRCDHDDRQGDTQPREPDRRRRHRVGRRLVSVPRSSASRPSDRASLGRFPLPTESTPTGFRSAVWQVDAGAGAVWAATPRLGAVWKIDPKDDTVTRIPMPYPPGGVAADSDAVWVTVRGD